MDGQNVPFTEPAWLCDQISHFPIFGRYGQVCILQVTFFSTHINNTFYSVRVPFISSPELNSTCIPALLLGASRRFRLFIQRLNKFWNQMKSIINKVMRNLLLGTFVSSLFRIEGRRKIAPNDSQRTEVTQSDKNPNPSCIALRIVLSVLYERREG